MGHYASELLDLSPTEPTTVRQRREAARHRADFVWELYAQKEQMGVWIDERVRLTCPSCFADIPALLREDHGKLMHSTEEE